MIYLAFPYTHEDPTERKRRASIVTLIAADYMRRGRLVFSPITYGHTFAQQVGSSITFEPWQEFNEYIIKRCTAVHVIQYPGWKESRGISAEIEFAHANGIPVEYIDLGVFA